MPRSADASTQIARDFMSDYDSNLLAISAVAAYEEIQINEDKRVTSRTCTYCKKESPVNLQSCPRCKAARYCDEECQRADYKGNHRRECTEFVHPPRTRAFRTHLIGDSERYPHSPIFAHGHDDGIGCWISTGNKVDCEMSQLSRRLVPDIKEGDPRYTARLDRMLDQPRKLAPAAKQNLTTLHVLVQNRRNDGVPVLLFGGHAQVITKASGTKDALRGRMGADDDVTMFTRNGKKHAAIGVVRDPWDNELRVHVAHINADAVDLPPYPTVLEDASQAIVSLSRGDYAVMSLQFRTGDGKTINRDWQAFRLLDHVVIPFMVWDSNARATTLASTLPPAYTLPTTPSSSSSAVKHLRLAFDQGAITRFYKDAIARGDSEFLRTHHGDIHAAMNISMNKATMVLTEATLRLAELPDSQRPVGWRDSVKMSIVGLL